MKKISKKTIVLFLIAILVFYLLFTAFSIISYGNKDYKTRSDAVIVLGAAVHNGEVSPVYRERLNHGIWLYENGYVDHLILTGGMGEGSYVSEAEIAKRYVLFKGVPDEAIFIEEKSTITEENLKYAKQIMDENSFETAIIVSDPLHMKRAMLMAKDYGITAHFFISDTRL